MKIPYKSQLAKIKLIANNNNNNNNKNLNSLTKFIHKKFNNLKKNSLSIVTIVTGLAKIRSKEIVKR